MTYLEKEPPKTYEAPKKFEPNFNLYKQSSGLGDYNSSFKPIGSISGKLPTSSTSIVKSCAAIAGPKTSGFPGCLNYTNITEYAIGKMLGNGAYACVKAASHKTSGMKLAIKVYDKFKIGMNA